MKQFFLIIILYLTSISFLFNQSNEMYNLSIIHSGVKNKRISSYDKAGKNNDSFDFIQPDSKLTIFEVKGAGIINHIWITMSPQPEKLNRNDIIIRMYWDNNEFPSVESPIGPFFGQGWNERYNFSSLPLAAGPKNGTGLVSYFAMPFSKGAKIEVENQSETEIRSFYIYVDYIETEKLPKELGRFHAWYNHELTEASPESENEWVEYEKQEVNTDGKNNYVFADIKGKGHFVGINYYIHCPSPMWYGEGDDMWFIDGDTLPTIQGTGTEDFFNTAWCPKEIFYHPCYGSPLVNNETGWLGRTHVYRFFIQDPIFFDKSLKGTIEHGHGNNMTLDIATVAYWYQSEATQLPPAPSKTDRQPKPIITSKDIHLWRQEWRKNKGNVSKLWGNER
jgi:hypothetical protein